MKIDVVAHLHAKPGKEADLQRVLEGFDLFRDLDQPGRFTFIEEWSSREALQRHGQSTHITAGRLHFPDLLAEPAWVQVITRVL
jgi:quinol monooxygenase YgiN